MLPLFYSIVTSSIESTNRHNDANTDTDNGNEIQYPTPIEEDMFALSRKYTQHT